jgi:hypothetical protein
MRGPRLAALKADIRRDLVLIHLVNTRQVSFVLIREAPDSLAGASFNLALMHKERHGSEAQLKRELLPELLDH